MRKTLVLVAASALLFVAACSTSGDSGADDLAEPEVNTPIMETSSVDETSTPQESTPQESTVETTTPRETCADLPKDPHDSFPSGSAPGRMPADDGSDNNYWIEDIDNQYDPCAELSWITFKGSLGDENGPQGLAGSIADGLALYRNGEPISEMKLFGRIDKVAPLENGAAVIDWSERGQFTAEGFVNHYSVDLRLTDDGFEAFAGDTEKFYERWDYPVGYLLGTYD